jgi:hypothetical protein
MSTERHCRIYRATDNKWYVELGDREYASRSESTAYGPFDSEDAANGELDQHSNPGSIWSDGSGTAPPPTESPNGEPLREPTRPWNYGYR